MSTFTSRKKRVSPYMNFYEWLAPQLPHNNEINSLLYDNEGPFGCPKGYNISVSKIGICEEDDEKLRKKVRSWIKNYSEKKYYKDFYRPECVDEQIDKVLAWHNLEIGPRTYHEKDRPKHIVPGYVYIEDDYMVEDKRYV